MENEILGGEEDFNARVDMADRCPQCYFSLFSKLEYRGNGHYEEVSYCQECGLTEVTK